MKTLVLTFIGLICLTNIDAQIIDFEGSLNQIEIYTGNAGNIWQIGQPQKTLFDSAYSAPNVIITDTVNLYPTSDSSSFVLLFDLWGSQPVISFMHKYDTDSAKDGGYVEISFDEGQTWTHLTAQTNENAQQTAYGFTTTNFYNDDDTLTNGKAAFNGFTSEWVYSDITFWCQAVKTSFECQLRFTFNSDSVETGNEGWIIDNIVVQNDGGCWGINEIRYNTESLKISPNPFQNQTTVTVVESTHIKNGVFTVFDMFGRMVSTRSQISGSQFTYDRKELKSGIYSYLLTDDKGFSASGKFVAD
jgi:hypothetical protein